MSWIKLLLVQFAIVCLILELIGLGQISTGYFWDYRYLYYSASPIKQIDDKTWVYQPDQKIRSIASYAFLNSFPWIEYDCIFDTNSLGFVDTNFNGQHSIDWVVLGDSFTEGQGGCPWLTRGSLDGSLISNQTIINAGLMGTGILQFERNLEYIREHVEINNILMIVISNDFKRDFYPDNYWLNKQKCLVNAECAADDYWWSLDLNASSVEILNKTKFRAGYREKKLSDLLKYYSYAYFTFNRLYNLVEVTLKSSSVDSGNKIILDKNFNALERIKQKHPEMKIILVPQRDEVGLLGGKNADTTLVETFFEKNKYDYSRCPLAVSDYMPIDGHPNRKGYEKLFKCVVDAVKSN